MKKLAGVALAFTILIGLSACGNAEDNVNKEDVVTNTVKVPVAGTDSTVTCIVYSNRNLGGEGNLDCNWEEFNERVSKDAR